MRRLKTVSRRTKALDSSSTFYAFLLLISRTGKICGGFDGFYSIAVNLNEPILRRGERQRKASICRAFSFHSSVLLNWINNPASWLMVPTSPAKRLQPKPKWSFQSKHFSRKKSVLKKHGRGKFVSLTFARSTFASYFPLMWTDKARCRGSFGMIRKHFFGFFFLSQHNNVNRDGWRGRPPQLRWGLINLCFHHHSFRSSDFFSCAIGGGKLLFGVGGSWRCSEAIEIIKRAFHWMSGKTFSARLWGLLKLALARN